MCIALQGYFIYVFGRTGGTYTDVGFDDPDRIAFDCNVYKEGSTLSSGQYGVWIYNNN